MEKAAKAAVEPDIFTPEVNTKINQEELKPWVLYPDGRFRSGWDLLMTV
jgi:hypothetical protein